MTAISTIWTQPAASSSPFVPAKRQTAATAADSATSATDTGATISANDFLTLLVTEMKNQDPTAQTDPNEYINQLVQVNSLEQLININQTLSTATGSSSTTPGSKALEGRVSASAGAGPTTAFLPSGIPSAQSTTSDTAPVSAPAPTTVSGNLSVPQVQPAAQRIAQALSGRN